MLIGRHSVARERAYIERDILTQLGRNWWMLVVVLNESRNDIVLMMYSSREIHDEHGRRLLDILFHSIKERPCSYVRLIFLFLMDDEFSRLVKKNGNRKK